MTKSWNHLSFVNISPILVIDTSMERSSRVVQHRNPKIWFFFSKKFEIEFWLVLNSRNHLSFVNISRTLAIDTSMERSSRVLHHGNPKIYFKKIKIEFWRMLTSWNHLSFVNISPTLEIDTSMERSSRVLQHAHGKCEFYKIKVAKARKISSVKRHFLSEVTYRGSVAVLFRCSLSTIEATSLPAPTE